jgi:hypothetical protein
VDERFESVQALHDACLTIRQSAKTSRDGLTYAGLSAIAVGNEVELLSRATGVQTQFTHWAFGQASQRAEAPAGYLRNLPATLAAQCLNHGFEKRASDQVALMFHQNSRLVLRSLTSERYDRIWNSEITVRLLDLLDRGWKVPPARPAHNDPRARPATAQDVLGDSEFSLSINIGDMIAPAGLYASDHDMFAFLVDPSRRIQDGSQSGLSRGFFVSNSEVGAASFRVTYFLYRHVCGNHIVWDASDVKQISIRHVGDASTRAFAELSAQLVEYDNASASDEESKIARARTLRLGTDKQAVLDKLLGMRLPVSKQTVLLAQANADEYAHENDPLSVYGMVNGLTRIAQDTPYADERVQVDRAASKVMSVAF